MPVVMGTVALRGDGCILSCFAMGFFSFAAAVASFPSAVLLSVCLSGGCTVHEHSPFPSHPLFVLPPAAMAPLYLHRSFLFFSFFVCFPFCGHPRCLSDQLSEGVRRRNTVSGALKHPNQHISNSDFSAESVTLI